MNRWRICNTRCPAWSLKLVAVCNSRSATGPRDLDEFKRQLEVFVFRQ